VVGRQPNTLATIIPEEIPGTHFQRLSLPQGTWYFRKEKIPSDTTEDRSRDRPGSALTTTLSQAPNKFRVMQIILVQLEA